ncbi:MAG: TRAM domain-containing protein [Acidobacteria bacterium]|nr:TRAM domain-containing protein [Acidobacteriota bacterium]
MVLLALRVFFVVIVLALATSYADSNDQAWSMAVYILLGALGLSATCIALDIFVPRKSLLTMSGLFFGLVVALPVSYGLSVVMDLMSPTWPLSHVSAAGLATIKVIVGVVCCYMAVSFILQTKDDVRFVIPYVEFVKQTKGARPMVLDTSVIIDGRIADICETRIVDSPLVIPRMVLRELQGIADSSDKLRRNRGRRGLDMLNKLQTSPKIDLQILDSQEDKDDGQEGVDQRLVTLAKRLDGRIVTNDYNLNKISQLRGVEVININDLANALKPVVLPGETMTVKIIKPGEEPGQGVGYLEDGTMVVVEAARDKIDEEITIGITSVLQTSAGRMIFGRSESAPPMDRRRRSSSRAAH